MNKIKKSTKQKAISVSELKTWLDGYCAASGEDWVPTKEQWLLIRGKIASLQEQVATPISHAASNNNAKSEIRYQQPEYKSEPEVTVAQHQLPKQTINTAQQPVMPVLSNSNKRPDEVGAPSPYV